MLKLNRSTPPRRFRFSVLEAAAAAQRSGTAKLHHTRPLPNAICKNCKQSDHLVQRPLVDPSHIYFCTNCGLLTPTRAVRHRRGLMAPTIQQSSEPGQSGIAQPGSTIKVTRTPIGIHSQKNVDPVVDSLSKRVGYTILDSQYVEPS